MNFEEYLKTQNMELSTRAQYVTIYNKFKQFLQEQQTTQSIQTIQDFLNQTESNSKKNWNLCVIKKILIYEKSPLLFEINKIQLEKEE
jgi:hypothetical protein